MPGGDEPTEDEVENMFTSIGWADDGRDREGVIQLESAGIQLDGSPVNKAVLTMGGGWLMLVSGERGRYQPIKKSFFGAIFRKF